MSTTTPKGDAMSRLPSTDLEIARNIVNQLFDEAAVPVAVRQRINDDCDAFVVKMLRRYAEVLRAVGDGQALFDGRVYDLEAVEYSAVKRTKGIFKFISLTKTLYAVKDPLPSVRRRAGVRLPLPAAPEERQP